MKRAVIVAMTTFLLACVTACVQMPTEKHEVVDMRPQISFRLVNSSLNASQLRVFVDTLDMGSVGSYLEGQAAMRVLPGTHLVRVEDNGRPVLSERVYVSDGVSKTLLVN